MCQNGKTAALGSPCRVAPFVIITTLMPPFPAAGGSKKSAFAQRRYSIIIE